MGVLQCVFHARVVRSREMEAQVIAECTDQARLRAQSEHARPHAQIMRGRTNSQNMHKKG
jgi:hypothetical protein